MQELPLLSPIGGQRGNRRREEGRQFTFTGGAVGIVEGAVVGRQQIPGNIAKGNLESVIIARSSGKAVRERYCFPRIRRAGAWESGNGESR